MINNVIRNCFGLQFPKTNSLWKIHREKLYQMLYQLVVEGHLGIFCNNEAVLLFLMQKRKLSRIELVTSSKRENCIMRYLRLDDKQCNEKLFWSVISRGQWSCKKSQRKSNIKSYVNSVSSLKMSFYINLF